MALVIALVILGMETLLKGSNDGTLLLTLSFWVTLIYGPVIVVAVADASQGKWILPMKYDLLAFYPLILFISVLFLILSFQMDIYPWMNESHQWLNADFFILRNFFLMLLSFLLAHFYVKASLKGKSSTGILAVLFILSFVVVQSLVAVDWIMSLEYPWMSTMFPPLFFIESFYAGLAIGAILAAYLIGKKPESRSDNKKVMRDMALFMFGFALAWAGLYYGQFLVIWYGNIPWETSFFAKRMHATTFNVMMYLIIFLLFILPFIGFVSRKSKTNKSWVVLVSVLVLAGILIERIFYILPVLDINVILFIVESLLIGFLFLVFILSRHKIIAAE
jgi:hypothetical protein